jgi:hypothetical protein
VTGAAGADGNVTTGCDGTLEEKCEACEACEAWEEWLEWNVAPASWRPPPRRSARSGCRSLSLRFARAAPSLPTGALETGSL